MKKIIICIILLGMIWSSPVTHAKDTGHASFEEITFESNSTTKLLVDMNYQEKANAHKELTSKKFIGWVVGTMNRNADATYVAETIFSRSNVTSTPFEFNYSLKEGDTIETSVSADGSIASKNKGKIKSVEAALDILIRGQIAKKSTATKSEETKIKINIEPNTKISMKIKGEAKVSNGVGKYFFFGIKFKSGEWEYVDVITKYYELSEERLMP